MSLAGSYRSGTSETSCSFSQVLWTISSKFWTTPTSTGTSKKTMLPCLRQQNGNEDCYVVVARKNLERPPDLVIHVASFLVPFAAVRCRVEGLFYLALTDRLGLWCLWYILGKRASISAADVKGHEPICFTSARIVLSWVRFGARSPASYRN